MAKPIHSMIRVLDEGRSVAFYETAFGLTIKDRFDFDSFTLIYMTGQDSTFELELTVNKGRTAPYDLGDGYGHIAFAVDDVKASHKMAMQNGLEPRDIVEFAPGGKPLATFYFIADPDGYQIEVLQAAGRYR